MELFAALDQQTRLFLGAEVREIWARTKQTVVFVTHDIDQVILLSQQVWVMSYRPGTIIDVVDIDLPASRDAGVVSTPRFNELHNRVWSSLQAESMRGFKQQETVTPPPPRDHILRGPRRPARWRWSSPASAVLPERVPGRRRLGRGRHQCPLDGHAPVLLFTAFAEIGAPDGPVERE